MYFFDFRIVHVSTVYYFVQIFMTLQILTIVTLYNEVLLENASITFIAKIKGIKYIIHNLVNEKQKLS